ncbi:hypothetical protein [Candidatus Mycoplasma haematohominis]|uniref:hypothetical protein n=1 Tax=Candidatus Mycoplasma haematohominis TaxID=1494318 RepID=UPI001C0A6EE1|nr:hypothetical protein [Candidatus Mycoplasma haemohominis]
MSLAKGAAGLGATALVITGGVGGYYFFSGVPACSVISANTTTFSSYSSKYGHFYGDYLVDPNKLDGDNNNSSWWTWAYGVFTSVGKENVGEKFKSVEKSFSSAESDATKALNKVCDSAYKAEIANVTSTKPASTDTTKFWEEDVWKFCSISPYRAKPILLSSSQDGSDKSLIDSKNSGKFGATHKDKLVSTKDYKNQWFWDLKEEQLKKETVAEPESTEKNIFKLMKKNKRSVRDTCQDAYLLGTSDNDGKATDAELKKYCFLEKTS